MKTTITLLILGLTASFASADMIWLQMAPGSTPTPGGTVEIQLVADTPAVGWRLRAARAPLGCSVSGKDDWTQHSNVGGMQWQPSYVDNYDHADGYTYLFVDSSWRENSTYGNPPIAAGEVLVSFDLTIHDTWDGVTPFTLELLGDDEIYYYDGGSEALHGDNRGVFGTWANPTYASIADLTIPEPATLCLLAGGGISILLRRRRAKNN